MISYAQNFEDIVLNRVFRKQDSGFYIDVGAMDPEEGSITKAFYDRGWRGINIEPDTRFHTKLCANRVRDINLNVAVGDVSETRRFFAFEDQGISTFSERFRDYFVERGRPFKETVCSVTTLAEICHAYVGEPIDFLKIDAEGWEGAVLRGADWTNFRPHVLLLEATEPYSHKPLWAEWEPFLLEKCGYIFVYFDGLNRFYVREENQELSEHFAFPVNVLDEFQLSATVRAEERATQAQQLLCEQQVETRELKDELAQAQAQLHDSEAETVRLKNRLAAVQGELLEMKLWVGRLSEEVAAAKVR